MGNNTLFQNVRKYGLNSLFVRNFVIILTIVLLPLGSLSYAVLSLTNRNTVREVNALNLQSLEKTRDTLDTVFTQIKRLSVELYLEEPMQYFVLAPDVSAVSNDKIKQISRTLSTFTLIYDYINSIYVYSGTNRYLLTPDGMSNMDMFPDNAWFPTYASKLKNKVLDPWYDNRRLNADSSNYPYLISFYQPIQLYPPQTLGLVVINIDVQKLDRLVGSKDEDTPPNFIIVDDQGTIYYDQDESLIGMKLQDQPFFDPHLLADNNYISSSASNHQEDSIVAVSSKVSDMHYISIVRRGFHHPNDNGLVSYAWSFVGISMVIAILISFLIAFNVYRPIRSIISVITNHYGWKESGRKGGNETQHITSSILKSFDLNRTMEEELADSLIRLEQAQTLALQSQINPHFLHNTLETIRILIIKAVGFHHEAAEMIASLSDMLRISMESNNYLISMADEIAHAKRYLYILQIRYRGKFDIVWRIPDEVLAYKMVKLSLQPLIENAIRHGIIPNRKPGLIKIQLFLHEDAVEVEISDNGVGMTEETLLEQRQRLKDSNHIQEQHLGLTNVHGRIRLLFGERYGLILSSEPGNGTCIRILIPKIPL